MAARKLILCVIDAMTPAMLEQALAAGALPTLAALIERGHYVGDCVAAFPSVTPVCAASIMTGTWQERHGVPGMNWYDRERRRYVEYGSSLRAALRVGLPRQLTDMVYNLNQAHLAAEVPTLFELLDDHDVRTAGTTYLVYRGRHLHEPRRQGLFARLASPLMRHPVMGPRELFYADIFASRATPCTSMLGMPGLRDRHSGCVARYLIEHDLFDFLLLSLPDNDWSSHRHGPQAQLRSLAQADAELTRVADAAGGLEALLAEHALIVMGDHAQAGVVDTAPLGRALAQLPVVKPGAPAQDGGIALCPSQRAAMLYLLGDEPPPRPPPELLELALGTPGVELVAWLERDSHGAPVEGAIACPGAGELRFAPGGELADDRGRGWSVDGRLAALGAGVEDGRVLMPLHPDGLARLWSALLCRHSGDVLLSAAPGYEFADWGGQAHVGGGSHGSLRGEDSLTALVLCGLDPPSPPPGQWTICDVAAIVAAHFGTECPAFAEGPAPVP